MSRLVILTASMGSGHTDVAAELARRRRACGDGDEVIVVDLLDVLPAKIGPMLRSSYRSMLTYAPWLYDAIYHGFFAGETQRGWRPDPLVAISAPAVRRVVNDFRPDAVVSTFHLAAQIVGRLRATAQLGVRSVVVVTDLVAHRMWLHPGNDLVVCPHPATAAEAGRGGSASVAAAPIVRPDFVAAQDKPAARARLCAEFGLAGTRPIALVSAGAWGTGGLRRTLADLLTCDVEAVVLCGRNDRLRTELSASMPTGRLVALGWRDDVAAIMRGCDVLVENAAGHTAFEALAVQLPVISYRPLPGHGRANVERMAQLHLSTVARDPAALAAAIRDVGTDSPQRDERLRAAAQLPTADAATLLSPAH